MLGPLEFYENDITELDIQRIHFCGLIRTARWIRNGPNNDKVFFFGINYRLDRFFFLSER